MTLHKHKMEKELKQNHAKLKRAMKGIIDAIANLVELKNPFIDKHQQHVTELACALAKEMGLSENQIEGIRLAATIHDVGLIGIPFEILSKPQELSQTESKIYHTHPRIGYNILKDIEFFWPIAEIVLQHHEMMDGSGFPQGLLGKGILLEARILSVANVLDNMVSGRPNQPALSLDKALEEISKNRGVLYDPKVVDACLRLFTEKGFKF
jgi:HD-GYP domain-containing protein (c-di-GMP phosphodiesterase class II)